MAKDKYHEAVRNALIKDGWTITHDPFLLKKKEAKIDYEVDYTCYYCKASAHEKPYASEEKGKF